MLVISLQFSAVNKNKPFLWEEGYQRLKTNLSAQERAGIKLCFLSQRSTALAG